MHRNKIESLSEMEESFWIFVTTLICVLCLAFKFFFTNSRKKYKLPPSPGPALPVIGHLHLFKPPLYRTFQRLSEKTGPILSVRFGRRLFVVVSSPEAVEECFTKNDVVLANRPRFIIGKYVGYNYTTFTAAPYGDHWRNLRRLTSIEIFSTARLNAFLSIRKDEVCIMLRKLYGGGESSSKVELKTSLSELTFNIILRMIAGKRYFGEDVKDHEEAVRFRSLIKEVVKYGGASNPGDFLPILGWLDYGGFQKNLTRIGKQMDSLLQGLIEEHRRDDNKNTMVNHLLSLQESEPEYYTDEIIKGLMIVMVIAGTDTSSVTIEWAMSQLLNHPEILKKAKAEIDKEVGESRLVDEPDLPKLPYLQNIILETLRLFPSAPLLIPHESSEDFKLGEYDVPKGTIVLVNAWAIQRDPNVWDDPMSFNPDRFDHVNTSNTSTAGGAVMVANSKLLPFGMGRRQCPGSGLAQRMVGLALASMIQCFNWERVSDELVDLAEGVGVTMPKANPLKAVCKPRAFARNLLFG